MRERNITTCASERNQPDVEDERRTLLLLATGDNNATRVQAGGWLARPVRRAFVLAACNELPNTNEGGRIVAHFEGHDQSAGQH